MSHSSDYRGKMLVAKGKNLVPNFNYEPELLFSAGWGMKEMEKVSLTHIRESGCKYMGVLRHMV